MSHRQVYSEALPFADLMVRSAGRHQDHPAVVFPDCTLTYADLLRESTRVAKGLFALGTRRGHHVGVLLPNCPELLYAIFGAALLGAVVVPFNGRYRSAELAHVIPHSDVRLLLTTDEFAPRTDYRAALVAALPGLGEAAAAAPLCLDAAPALKHVVLLSGLESLGFVGAAEFKRAADEVDESVVEDARARVRVADDAMIVYTSGTTAHPKGCVLGHEAVSRGPVGRTAQAVPFNEPVNERVMWCPAPLFHIAALQGLLCCVAQGATFLTDYHLDGPRALDAIRTWRATTLWPMFMPPMDAVFGAAGFPGATLDHVTSVVTVGTPDQLRAVQAAFPTAVLVNGSGMSEMAGHYCLSPLDETAELRATTSGRPVAGVEMRIVDSTGADLPDGSNGELLVRGFAMMSRYHKDPERTAETIDADGWLHTGDLFVRLPSGHFRFLGRLKDVLRVGGESVPPVEIEEFLLGHSDVVEAQVVGVPDARLDEVPVAFVELRSGTRVEESDLLDFCRGRIASFKVPRRVYVIGPGDWPRSATKISKVGLRAMARSRSGAATTTSSDSDV